MAEPTTPVEGAKVEQPQPEAPKQPEVKLDPTTPLTQQTKVLDKLLTDEPKSEDKEDDKKDSPESDKTDKTEDKSEDPKTEDKTEEKTEEEPELDLGTEYEEPKELPPVAKYILDRLPDIQVMGRRGDNGKDQMFKVKRVEDLPPDFEFSSRRDELIFNAAIASQELNARELLNKYNQEQQQAEYQKFLNQQALDVESDIKSLQNEGVLPKFQYAPTDSRFDTDPAVKEANEIYALFEKTNKAYADAKKTYRISFRDAADKYYAQKARTAPKDTKDEPKKEAKAEPTKGDQERQQVARRVGAPQGANPNQTRRSLPPGATLKDVLKAYNNGAI